MHFGAKFFQQNLLSITGLSLIGILPLGQVAAQCPQMSGSGIFSGYWNIFYHFQQVLLKEFCSKMDSWACPCRGPTPGAGWTPPRCPGGSGNFLECYLYPVYLIPHWVTVTMWPPWAFEAIILIAMIWILPPKCLVIIFKRSTICIADHLTSLSSTFRYDSSPVYSNESNQGSSKW